MADETQGDTKHWEVFSLYQEGKMKRYGLLFSVNGGAYAVVTWVAEHPETARGAAPPFTRVAIAVSLAASLFTALMFVDVWMFGRMMKDNAPDDGLTYFGGHGKAVLATIAAILTGAWMVVLDSSPLPSLAAVPVCALAAAIAWIAASRPRRGRVGRKRHPSTVRDAA